MQHNGIIAAHFMWLLFEIEKSIWFKLRANIYKIPKVCYRDHPRITLLNITSIYIFPHMAFGFPVFCQNSIIIHVVSQIHFLVKIDNVFGVLYQRNPLNLVCIKDGLSPILKTVCCFWVLLFSNIKLIDSLLKPIAQKFHWDVIKPKYLGAVFDVYILRSAMKIGFHT